MMIKDNEKIIKKIKELYKEMEEIDNSRILSNCETGDLCFYLGLEYIRKSIRELEANYNEQLQ